MKLFIFSLSLILFLFVKGVSADFVKSNSNPLVTSPLLQHSILYENNIFKMWHTAFNNSHLKISFATSQDGLQWSNSNFITLPDNGEIHDPFIFNSGSSRYLYYVDNEQVFKKALSQSDTSFTQIEQITLDRAEWNNQTISCPSVYHINGVYYLFYCGRSFPAGYSLGLATSSDGTTFTNCQNNPILTGNNIGNTQLVDEGAKYSLYFHTNNGIEVAEIVKPLQCNSVIANQHVVIAKDQSYDNTQILSPSILRENNKTYLFYTGRGTDWKLNLAIDNTPLTPKKMIVFLPGFFGSWNKDAILHNNPVDDNEWKITHFIHEYDGILQTLQNIGLQEGVDYVVFSYDWRKGVEALTTSLKQYLESSILQDNPNTTFSLIGHSYGGLIARVFAQKNNEINIDKIITLATPHNGIVQVYKPLSAGKLEKMDNFVWLGSSVMTILYGDLFTSKKDFYRTFIPSLFDLFPTFSFLQNKTGLIDIDTMHIKNDLLSTYNPLAAALGNKLITIYGKKDKNTPIKYKVRSRGIPATLLGNWEDGVPMGTIFDEGDYLTTGKSATLSGITNLSLPLDHNEVIYKKDGIKTVLDFLGLTYQDSQIQEGSKTTIIPSLMVFIQSPVAVTVKKGDQVYEEKEGVIFLPDVEPNEYEISITGTDFGQYKLSLGQIGLQGQMWERIEGDITENPPSSQTDIYIINVNDNKPTPQFKESGQVCKLFKRKGKKRYRWYFKRKNNKCIPPPSFQST